MSDEPKVYDKPARGAVPAALSHNTLQAMEMMRATEVGDTITWDRFVKTLDRSLEGVYGTVRSARKILLREGIVFKTVVDVGIERISHDEAAEVELPKGRDGIRRRARRLYRYSASLNTDQMSETNKTRTLGTMQLARMAEIATESRTLRKLTAGGSDQTRSLADSFERLAELHRRR